MLKKDALKFLPFFVFLVKGFSAAIIQRRAEKKYLVLEAASIIYDENLKADFPRDRNDRLETEARSEERNF